MVRMIKNIHKVDFHPYEERSYLIRPEYQSNPDMSFEIWKDAQYLYDSQCLLYGLIRASDRYFMAIFKVQEDGIEKVCFSLELQGPDKFTHINQINVDLNDIKKLTFIEFNAYCHRVLKKLQDNLNAGFKDLNIRG